MENLRRASISVGEFVLRGALILGIGRMIFQDYHPYVDKIIGLDSNSVVRVVLLSAGIIVISSGSWFNKEKKAQVEEDDTE